MGSLGQERRPAGTDVLLIVVATLVVYALTPWGTWHFDDGHHVRNNPSIRSLENVPRFFQDSSTFSSMSHHRLYRPVLMTSFALDYALWKGRAHGFLVTNILLHLLTALAVMALARVVLGPTVASLFSGLLFAAHPLGSEVVNYVSARSSSLATLFVVLSVLAFVRAARTHGIRMVAWYLLSYLMFAGGLFTKSIAITVPILAFLATLACDAREGRRRGALRRLLPLLPMLGVIVGWHLIFKAQVGSVAKSLAGRVTESVGGDHLSREKRSVLANLATQSRVFWIYVSLVVLPVDLSVDRFVRISEGFGDPWALASLVAIAVLVGLVLWRGPWLLRLSVLWFGVALGPTSSFFPLLVIMNEHRPYLPMVGITLIGGAALGRVFAGGRWGRYAVSVLFVLLGVLAFDRTRDWRSEEVLWKAAAESSPRSYQAHTNLGWEYYEQALDAPTPEEADLALLRKSLVEYALAEAEYPGWYNITIGQGLVHMAIGRVTGDEADFDRAVERFERCLEISPGLPRARKYLAETAFHRGDYEDALRRFRAFLDAEREETDDWHWPVARCLGKLDRWPEAEAMFREGIAIREREGLPVTLDLRILLLGAIEEQGRLDEAESGLRKLVAERLRSGRRHLFLARFLRRTGRGKPGEIQKLFQQALEVGYRPTAREREEVLEGGKPASRGTARPDRQGTKK